MISIKGKTITLRINLMTCYLIGLLYKGKTFLQLYKNFFYFFSEGTAHGKNLVGICNTILPICNTSRQTIYKPVHGEPTELL